MKLGALVVAGSLVVTPLPAMAAEFHRVADQGWCRGAEGSGPRWHTYCEVREATLTPWNPVAVDATPNGGVAVQGWDEAELRVQARVSGRSDEGSPEEIVGAVVIESAGTIRARGPAQSRHRSWDVSYRVSVPSRSALDLRSTNGGIAINGVRGKIAFETLNGGVRLASLGGEVHGRTTNGGLDVTLDGTQWPGEGLDVETTNGGVELRVPHGYNAHLEAGTVNGALRTDMPITVEGRIGHRLSADLGAGGATVRALTTNGGVAIRAR